MLDLIHIHEILWKAEFDESCMYNLEEDLHIFGVLPYDMVPESHDLFLSIYKRKMAFEFFHITRRYLIGKSPTKSYLVYCNRLLNMLVKCTKKYGKYEAWTLTQETI